MKRKFLIKKKKIEKYSMASVNLGKNLEYLNIQEILRSEYLTEYCLCKGIFLYVFLYPEKYYTSSSATVVFLWILRNF